MNHHISGTERRTCTSQMYNLHADYRGALRAQQQQVADYKGQKIRKS